MTLFILNHFLQDRHGARFLSLLEKEHGESGRTIRIIAAIVFANCMA